MIRRKTSLGIMLLAALAATVYWAGRSQIDRAQQPITGLDTRLDYALQDFELKLFDLDGLLSANLNAPVLKNDATTGISRIDDPAIELVHLGDLWNVVAQTAFVAADREKIILTGDVWMRRAAGSAAGPLEINTSELTLEVAPRTAASDRPVRMVDGQHIMEAVGFRVNIKDNTFALLNQVKLTYAVY